MNNDFHTTEVIIVEDDEVLSGFFKKELEKDQIKAQVFTSFKSVKSDLTPDNRPRVFVVDKRLGRDKDAGLNVVKWIRSNFTSAYIMVLTQDNEAETQDRFMKAGATIYKRKAIKQKGFLSEVQQIKNITYNYPIAQNNQVKEFPKKYAMIDDIEKNSIVLNCYVCDNPFDKTPVFSRKKYPKEMFVRLNDDEIYINKPVEIRSAMAISGITAFYIEPSKSNFPHKIFDQKNNFKTGTSSIWDIKE